MAPLSATKMFGLLALLLAASSENFARAGTTDTSDDCGGTPSPTGGDGTPAPTRDVRCIPSLTSSSETNPTSSPTAAETPEPTISSGGATTVDSTTTGTESAQTAPPSLEDRGLDDDVTPSPSSSAAGTTEDETPAPTNEDGLTADEAAALEEGADGGVGLSPPSLFVITATAAFGLLLGASVGGLSV